jgi:hypothetical protein
MTFYQNKPIDKSIRPKVTNYFGAGDGRDLYVM